jgi:hypothetical protein
VLNPVDVRIEDGLSFAEWMSIGRRLLTLHSASAWWIGDWLVYGEWRYGEKYRAVTEQLEVNYHRLRDYAYVAGRVGRGVRRKDLTFSHHRVVAKLEPAEQIRWLAFAAEQKLTQRQFAAAVSAPRQIAGRPAISEQMRLTVERTRLEVWRQAAAANERDLLEWAASTLDAEAAACLGGQSESVRALGGIR